MSLASRRWIVAALATLVSCGASPVWAADQTDSAPRAAHGLISDYWAPAEAANAAVKPTVAYHLQNQPAPQEPVAAVSFDVVNERTATSLAATNNSLGGDAATSADCDTCVDDCCVPLWQHRNGVFAELLYLRPGNIDVVYAVEQTGPAPSDSPTGPVGRVGLDAEVGYRVGFAHALSDCSSLQVTYSWLQSETNNEIFANPGTVLLLQPGHPSVANVGATSVSATADYDIRFQQVDLDYRHLLYGTENSAINYFAGLRYANLEQNFAASEIIGVPNGLTTVRTDINFDGFGVGFGLDGERRSSHSGLLVYGKGSASFVSGEFKADFRQTNQFGPNSVIGNSLVDYRVVSILQTELGMGWQSECGRFRVTAGYQFAGWFNSLTTGSYIEGVQAGQYHDLNETITFDGLVSRVEWRF